jgi:hypothetical protein
VEQGEILRSRGVYYGGVERVVRIDHAYLIAAAAAHDLNDELTVIVSSLEGIRDQLGDGHPAQPLLHELHRAVQRCIWKAAALQKFGVRRNAGPTSSPLERLLAS